MSHDESIERRGAQAMIATYLQMTRHVELARFLQQTRERSMARRIESSSNFDQALRLQQQLDAQQAQAAAIEQALEHLQSHTHELKSFASAGLSYEDFKHFGLDSIVSEEEFEAAKALPITDEPPPQG